VCYRSGGLESGQYIYRVLTAILDGMGSSNFPSVFSGAKCHQLYKLVTLTN
jgi:hypothetical protein